MDPLYAGIVTLLRSALNEEALKLPENFDWDRATDLLFAHHLTGLGMHGAVLCGVHRSHPAVKQMAARFCQTLQTSRLQMQKLQEVFALFEANGIDYMPVKGSVIKPLYPRMEYRIMGDADILIRPEQYSLIQSLLPTLGLQEKDNSNYEYTWQCPALTLELHRYLVSPVFRKYFPYYKNSWQHARRCDEGFGYRLTPEAHFVYFFVHFAKHYLNGTICAKDICDFYVWRRAYPEMNEAYVLASLNELKLVDFYHNISDLLGCWFCGQQETEAVALITQAAFQGGVYTQYNQSAAGNVLQRHSGKGDSLGKKKLKWFVHALFPSRKSLAYAYPVLNRAAVLLPVFWVVRWLDALFRDRDKLRRGMIVANMDSNSLSAYSSHMARIGLDSTDQD